MKGGIEMKMLTRFFELRQFSSVSIPDKWLRG